MTKISLKTSALLGCMAVLLMTSCSSREAVDQRLAKGCEAGARAFLNQDRFDRQLDKVKKATFSTDDNGRTVLMQASTKNKAYGYGVDEVLTCVFSEEYSMGFISWSANLEKLTIGDDVIGRDVGQIQGGMQDYLAINQAVTDAMK